MKKLYILTLMSTLAAVNIIFLMGCAGSEVVRTTDNIAVESPDTTVNNQAMSIEGTVTEVMESWPLQLIVETNAGSYHVALSTDTTITQNNQASEASQLTPDKRVVITGEASSNEEKAMIAQSIEIQ